MLTHKYIYIYNIYLIDVCIYIYDVCIYIYTTSRKLKVIRFLQPKSGKKVDIDINLFFLDKKCQSPVTSCNPDHAFKDHPGKQVAVNFHQLYP